MKVINLDRLCKAFNWQGGTIHQAHAELKKYCLIARDITTSELIDANEAALNLMVFFYKQNKEKTHD